MAGPVQLGSGAEGIEPLASWSWSVALCQLSYSPFEAEI